MNRSVLAFSLALGLAAAGALRANEECPHAGTTVQDLRNCVEHAFMMGHIDNAGIAVSLLAKLDAAQAALDRGQPTVAVALLEAFIQEVQAQGGQHIEPPHDQHMVAHAEQVIASLSD